MNNNRGGLFIKDDNRLRNRVLTEAPCTRCGQLILTTRPSYPHLICTDCQYAYLQKGDNKKWKLLEKK